MGVLAIGTNPNPATIASSNLTRDVTTAVFVAIWAMVILGAVFNALTITKPIRELLNGVKNIAKGNFQQRVDLPEPSPPSKVMNFPAVIGDQSPGTSRISRPGCQELVA